MKLAKIQHYRCGEIQENATCVWVPDDMAEGQLEALVERARIDCLDAESKVDGKEAPSHLAYWDWLTKADKNITLATADIEYAKHKAEHDYWIAKRDAARKSFAQRLVDLSNGEVKMFHDFDCPLNADCDWGHNHGKRVDYGETKF